MMAQVRHGDIKLIMLGDANVGKTSIFRRMRGDSAESIKVREPTGEVRVIQFPYTVSSVGPVMVDLFDTAGEEMHRAVTETFFRNLDGAVLVYDLTRPETLTSLVKYWIPRVLAHAMRSGAPPPLFLLLGNKSDLVRGEHTSESKRAFKAVTVDIKTAFPDIGLVAARCSALTWSFVEEKDGNPIEQFILRVLKSYDDAGGNRRHGAGADDGGGGGVVILGESRRVKETREGQKDACWEGGC